ncbi:helix-turn-helix domain-containing protein [Cohnella sp. GCM10012308]
MENSDIVSHTDDTQKAPRAAAYRSEISEHFQGDFPIFINRWEEGFALREHDHAYLEIVYVMSGDGFHYVGDRIERTTKGCLYVLPVGTSHILRPSDAAARRKLVVYNLCIRPEFLEVVAGWLAPYGRGGEVLAFFEGSPGAHLSLFDQRMEIGRHFVRMHREFTEKRLGYEANLFAGLLQIAVRLARLRLDGSYADEAAEAADSGRKGLSMSDIQTYIDLHATEPLTAESLAAQAGLSPRHFIRLFQKSAGTTFSGYLQLRRIEYACKLLHETAHKISVIASLAGYRDQAHFRAVFREQMGMSPSEYRKGGGARR